MSNNLNLKCVEKFDKYWHEKSQSSLACKFIEVVAHTFALLVLEICDIFWKKKLIDIVQIKVRNVRWPNEDLDICHYGHKIVTSVPPRPPTSL